MKPLIALLISFFMTTAALGAAPADDVQPLIRQAESAANDGDYKQAAQAYEKLVERFPYDPALLYNLGTAYAKQGRRGPAIWRYLQALELAPRDRETRQNLALLAPDLSKQTSFTPLPPVDALYRSLTGNEWTLGAALLTAAALGGTIFLLTRPRGARSRATLKKAAWTAGSVAAVCWVFSMAHYVNEELTWRGVIVGEQTVARTGPSQQQIETFALPAGTLVKLEKAPAQGWVKVIFGGGRVGFIPRGEVESL